MSTTSEEQNKSGAPSAHMNNSRSGSFGSEDSVADLYETPNNQLYRGERSSRQTQNENGQPAGAKIGGGEATQQTNYRTFADQGANMKAGAAHQGNDSEEETFLGSLTRRASYLHFDVPILSFNERERPSARSSGSLDEHAESAPASARESGVGAMEKAVALKSFAEARVFFRSQMTPDNKYMWDGPRQALPMLFFFLLLLFATVVAPVLYWYGGGKMPPLRKILDKDRTPFGDEIDGTRTIVFSPLLFTARFIEQVTNAGEQPGGEASGVRWRLPLLELRQLEENNKDLSGEENFEKWEAQAVAPIDDSTGRKNLFPNYHEGPGSRFKWAQLHIIFHCLIAAWGIVTLFIMKYRISWWPLVSYTMQSWTMFTLRHLVAAILLVFSRCGGFCGSGIETFLNGVFEFLRFPALAQATVTFVVWWMVMVPVICVYLLTKKNDRKTMAGPVGNVSFFQINVHGLNLLFAYWDHVWLDPRPLLYVDLYFAILTGILYLTWYILILDYQGIHLYLILNPRSNWAVAAYLLIPAFYVGIFYCWRPFTPVLN